MEKPKIDYPCDWIYKIVVSDKELLEKTIPNVLKNICFKLLESNRSKTGKYTSFNLTARVDSEEKKNEIFNILKDIPTVRIIL